MNGGAGAFSLTVGDLLRKQAGARGCNGDPGRAALTLLP